MNPLTTIPSKMILSKRLGPSLANPKKLIRPQKALQSKNAVKLASVDIYNFDLKSNASTAIDGDDSFRLYIAYKVEEILNAARSKGILRT
jgi:hypothetical protein